MYIYIYISIYLSIYRYKSKPTYTDVPTSAPMCLAFPCLHICVNVRTHARRDTFLRPRRVRIYTYVRTCTHAQKCVYTPTCKYTRTHVCVAFRVCYVRSSSLWPAVFAAEAAPHRSGVRYRLSPVGVASLHGVLRHTARPTY